jgi:hypothetical protein
MHTFQGIAIDAGVSIDGDCTVTHRVSRDCIEIDFGQGGTGGLNLCLTENAAAKLADVITVALSDFRQHRDSTDRPDQQPSDR